MATKLEQMKAEMEKGSEVETNTPIASAKDDASAHVNTAPGQTRKPSWVPRWVAVMGADGHFAKFAKVTATAPREQVVTGDDGKIVALNIVAGSTLIGTVDVPSDSSIWSAKTALNRVNKEFTGMISNRKIESPKDGSADVISIRFGNDLELRIYVGGINNSAIPAEIANKHGLVVFHGLQSIGGWMNDTLITSNFDEAIDWIKARIAQPDNKTADENSSIPF